MQVPSLFLADVCQHVDGKQRSETANRRAQGSQHAQLGTIVAVVGVKGIANEASVARATPEKADLTLELNGRRREQGNPKLDASIADGQARREIIAAVDYQVVRMEELLRVFSIDACLDRIHEDVPVQAMRELRSHLGLCVTRVALPEERLALEVREFDHV
jgi:hypothetical protein